MTKTIIFMHIPKTGGTSLIDVMQRQYGTMSKSPDSDFIDMSEWMSFNGKFNCKAVAGHFSYGIHSVFADYQYITLLRHPVARIVSMYNYINRLGGEGRKWWVEQGVINNISLLDFVKLPITNIHNGMVRQISGMGEFYYKPVNYQVGIDDYNLAVKNLDNFLVGFTDEIDKSVRTFAKRFGWKVERNIPHVNKSPDKTELELNSNYSYKVYDTIVKNNEYDVLLYHKMKERFSNE